MPLKSFYFDEIKALDTLFTLFNNYNNQLSIAYQICFGKLLDQSAHPINLVLQRRYDRLADHQLARLVSWLGTLGEPLSLNFEWPHVGSMFHALSDNINEQFLAIQASLDRGEVQHNTNFISYKYKYTAYGYLRRLHNGTYSYSLREFDVVSEETRGYYTVNNLKPNASTIRKKMERYIKALRKSRIYKLDLTDWVGTDSCDTRYVFDTRNGLPSGLAVGRRILEKPCDDFYREIEETLKRLGK